MNRLLTLLVILSIATVLPGSAFAQRGKFFRGFGNSDWLISYQKAREQAAKTKKPIMMVIRCVP